MAKTLEFFFDFMSPPTYLAWTRIPGIVERTGCAVVWRPMLTLGLFQLTGNRPPMTVPNKGKYGQADLQRFARRYGVTLNPNPHMMELKIVPALRGALVAQERGEFEAYARAMFEGMWLKGLNVGADDVWPKLLEDAGLDAAAYQAGIARDDIKEGLKANTQEAADRGAFGAPTFFVDGEMFWGQDRLDFVEEALKG
ncbi:MAG: 2-hydroxychromene-2-carboxylate isomerase [Alphaproteobacteria bacterium]|nr:2-hydroxychromene-2-carboxylate isomerase [Alphaproteobacteria bacterium]